MEESGARGPYKVNPSSGEGEVCAIVVTYNRKVLLKECLAAVLGQDRPVDRIVLVDNASTDGTLQMVETEFPKIKFPQVEIVRMPKNRGGAGGFHEGMRVAQTTGMEWLWLLDDDTIPNRDALHELFTARERFPEPSRPDLLSSKAIWKDGTVHPMNIPWVTRDDAEISFLAAQYGTLPLRTATFVSLLIHRRFIPEFGLPIADYFLGGDDVEYTARILQGNLGIAVPSSVVLHSTAEKSSALEGPAWKFYYYVRNTVWMLSRSSAFRRLEAAKLSFRFFRSLCTYLRRTRCSIASCKVIVTGLWNGIFTSPES